MACVVLVVPCFNEANRLSVDAFCRFALPGHDARLLFVNDGSTDETGTVLRRIAESATVPCAVLDLDRNGGKAEAVRRGVLHALTSKPDYVGFWDADLAAPLDELPRFVELLESRRDVEIVFGSRVKLMGRTIERIAWRHYLGRMSATLISATLDLPVYDTQCGHKLFRVTPPLAEVFKRPFLATWLFDVEILARFMSTDPRGRGHVESMLYEWPLTRWVDVRGSKVRGSDFFRGLAEVWRVRQTYLR